MVVMTKPEETSEDGVTDKVMPSYHIMMRELDDDPPEKMKIEEAPDALEDEGQSIVDELTQGQKKSHAISLSTQT